ncbi:hypothetical protein E2320_011323, partial [Naja naja]
VSLDFSIGTFHVEVKEWNEKGMERWKSHRRQNENGLNLLLPVGKEKIIQKEIQLQDGVGIDQHPIGVFVINQKTGEINITKIVDREETPMFVIHCHAINVMTGKSIETPLDLRVRVLDINDNPPIFTQHMFSGSIIESSMENTFVMKITATDADEPNNLNSKIAYKIESQTPSGPLLFILNTENGELHIAKALDREEQSQYTLVVKASDRNGGPDGISSECLCQVKVQDVNDNFPTLSQSSFSVSILENSLSQELLRIQVFDADQEFTDNWFAEFFFISGNENHNFEITIDRTTNEGILSVVKEIDYEQFSTININIGVRNVAPFHSSVASLYRSVGTPIVVQITNVIEGPAFSPSTLTVTASESLTSETILTYTVATFQAIDQDTGKVATNIRYEMGRDPAAWFQINPQTAVITFKKVIDRESIYVVNGVYTAEVFAITRGSPYTTATGTIMLTIQDINDNCPIVTEEIRRVCMNNPNVVITAKDPDDSPYGPPFTFSIIAQPQGSWWDIKEVNATSAALFTNNIEFIIYEVQVKVTDNSGKSCQRPLVIPLQACECGENGMCIRLASKRVKVIIIGGGGAGGGAGGGGAGGGGAGGGGAGGGGAGGGGAGGGGAGGGGAGGGGAGGGGAGGGGAGGGGTDWGTGGGGTDGGGGGGGGDDGSAGGAGGGHSHSGSSGHAIGVGGARENGGDTSLSAAAIALMILGGLIFVLVPILMSQSDCLGYLGSRSAGGVGAGFEPVPECTEGAIHSWGIEGAQPEDRDVSNICAPVTGASKGEFADSSDIYTTKYGDGGMVSSGIEETTGLGATKGYGTTLGYGTTAGYGTMGRKDTYGGIKEYRESGVNMAFLDSYFSEKAFAYADEDEGRPANDCLLIYDHEGIGTPVGSIGCCSFIGDDLDESYLDTLGPKFKTLAEICLGREIEPFPDLSMPLPNPDIEVNLPPPGTTIVVNTSSSMPQPPAVCGTTVITENAYTTTSNVQPPRPMPDPMVHGNVVVTETYTSGSTMKPPTLNVDPLSGSNVVVRERVLAPAPVTDLHGMIDIPDLPGGSNVVVTERVIAPNTRLPSSLSIPNLTEGSNVVVTERVIRPAASVHGNMTLPSDISSARNVVVTERVLSGTGATGVPGCLSSGPNSLLASDNLLSQTIGTASPGSTRRRVTKYSTIQYSN